MAKTVNIEILGDEYPIKANSETEEEYFRKVGTYVDSIMSNIKDNMHLASVKEVAILASLNIADDYFKHKIKYNKIILDLEEKIKLLTSSLDI